MKKILIENPRKYNICFAESFDGLAENIVPAAGTSENAFIVTDSNVSALYLDETISCISSCFTGVSYYVIEAGEASKTLANAEKIVKAMTAAGITRDDIVIALGGGVVGDLAGFCAAIYMRGIDFIQIPTTLLSQIDSSIGGKTAVDMDDYKNMIGAFHNPVLVYENSGCLKTLPKDQVLSGMGEVIKSALLGDERLWNYLLEALSNKDIMEADPETLIHILYGTCLVKKKVVEEDPFDTGKRAVLNLGHTFGHAVEKCAGFGLSHGVCVALGTICASYISLRRGYISKEEYDSIYGFIQGIGLETAVPEKYSLTKDAVAAAMSKDKKNGAGGLKFILLEGIGNAAVKNDLAADEISEALEVIGIR